MRFSLILTVLSVATLAAAYPVSVLERRASKASTVAFSTIDISKTAGNGQAAKAAADAACPSSDGAALLEQKRLAAEAVEIDFYNGVIADAKKAGDTAKATAVLCQKNRNKILKNNCQRVGATIKGDKAEITKNAKQVKKNIADTTKTCAGVDTSLFVTPKNAGTPTATSAKRLRARQEDPTDSGLKDDDSSEDAGAEDDAAADETDGVSDDTGSDDGSEDDASVDADATNDTDTTDDSEADTSSADGSSVDDGPKVDDGAENSDDDVVDEPSTDNSSLDPDTADSTPVDGVASDDITGEDDAATPGVAAESTI